MLFRPKQSMIDGQVGDNYPKKFCSKKTYPLFFWRDQNKRLTIHLYGLFFSFLFSVKFLQRSSVSAVLVNFFCTESLQPVWPQTCQLFTVVFFGIACARQDGSYNDNFIYSILFSIRDRNDPFWNEIFLQLCQHVWFEPAHIRINGLISKHKN